MFSFDFGTILLVWALIGFFAHELGHYVMAKIFGSELLFFYAHLIPPSTLMVGKPSNSWFQDAIVSFSGWLFGVASILLFIPLISSKDHHFFISTAIFFQTIISLGDFESIFHIARHVIRKKYLQNDNNKYVPGNEANFKLYNLNAKLGLGKMIVFDRKEYANIKEPIYSKYSITFADNMGLRGWIILLSILLLILGTITFFVNWPLSWFMLEDNIYKYDFSALFFILIGAYIVLTIVERLLPNRSRPHQDKKNRQHIRQY